jgi:putative ABC transport system ATP-binding protein
MLEVEHLVKHYRSGDDTVRALDGVSMTVAPGELVALYGPSGSGKTTLLTIVAALAEPDSGSVSVGGRVLSGMSRADAARYRRVELGYVTQSPDLLLGGSVLDNAALKLIGLRVTGSRKSLSQRGAHERVAPVLERLGLAGRFDHRPHQLSTGERQRVLLARALSTKPRLLLADEPTGNLDAQRSDQVLNLLTEVCREQQVALLLVTHDPQAAAFADRAHELRDGRLNAYEPVTLAGS